MWSRVMLGAFILSLPISVFRNVPPDTMPEDTVRTRLQRYEPGETRLTLAGGTGRYGVVESCEGTELSRTIVRQKDVAGELEHRFGRHVGLGVRGGAIHEEATTTFQLLTPAVVSGERTNRYVNPYLRLAGRGFDLSAGGIYSTEPFELPHHGPMHTRFSAGIGAGSLTKLMLRASWMEGVPLLDESGYLSVGVEMVPLAPLDLFVGAGAFGPHDDFAGVVRLQCWVGRFGSVNVSGKIGNFEAVQSWGATAGLTLRVRPRVDRAATRTPTAREATATPPDSSRRSP